MNVNFAPVADVPSGPGAALYRRSFRGSPSTIGKKVAAATRGYRRARVAATAKHFPGLGGASRNTDDARVVVPRSARRLQRIDLVPFRSAIAADVPLVMVSHALYPARDRRRVASQSRTIVTGLLRTRLGQEFRASGGIPPSSRDRSRTYDGCCARASARRNGKYHRPFRHAAEQFVRRDLGVLLDVAVAGKPPRRVGADHRARALRQRRQATAKVLALDTVSPWASIRSRISRSCS
jgi:hypothetical protein